MPHPDMSDHAYLVSTLRCMKISCHGCQDEVAFRLTLNLALLRRRLSKLGAKGSPTSRGTLRVAGFARIREVLQGHLKSGDISYSHG